MRNVCDNGGGLVGHPSLPADPIDHDVVAVPKLGCSNLGCIACNAAVRSLPNVSLKIRPADDDMTPLYDADDPHASPLIEPGGKRLYFCRCDYQSGMNDYSLEHDDDSRGVAHKWSCSGHPLAELPHTFDGVVVSAENIEEVVARGLANELPFATGPGDAEVWVARLRVRLENTPDEARVVDAAAAHLTHPDVATRVRAVRFFTYAPAFTKAMRAEVLLGEHAALFVGIANPRGVMTFQKTLDGLLWWLCREELATNEALRAIARAFSLDPSRSCPALLDALADYASAPPPPRAR